jgi:hypothetical protein
VTSNAIEKIEPEAANDADGRAIESLVMRGDISGLAPRDRAAFYVELCKSLRLNPATQPIKFIVFQGKLLPYFTRDATDQIAARERLNREIIAGPEVRDFAGHKLLYALCKGTLPNGRVETASALVPIPNGGGEALANAVMKTETKSRRRVTLAILGLGFIDESELDTMAGARRLTHAEAMGGLLEAGTTVADAEPVVLAKIRDDIAQTDGLSIEGAAAIWCDHAREIGADHAEDARDLLLRACGASVASLRRAVAAEAERRDSPNVPAAPPASTVVTGEPIPPADLPPVLAAFDADVDSVELPGEAVALWIKYRPELAALVPADREYAWKALCLRTEAVGKMKNAKVWLKRCIAEEDARRAADREPPPDGDGPKRGRAKPAANDGGEAAGEGVAAEGAGGPQARSAGEEAAAWERHLAAKTHAFEIANSCAKHEHEYPALGIDGVARIAIARIVAVSAGTEHEVGPMNALNAIKVARTDRDRKATAKTAAARKAA